MRKALSTILALVLALASFAQGLDKPAMEKFFMDGLARYAGPYERPVPEKLQRIEKNMYVADYGHYETESVRAVSYFQKKKHTYIPIRDSEHPVESVTTLLSGYTGDSRYKVYLTQHRYNYALEEVEVSLNQLLGFCILECGFVPYVGIESSGDGKVKASLFLVNESIGYCHTLNFIIPISMLDSEDGLIQAEAYTFTPIHNLAR